MKTYGVGIIIGRFQPFHNGHAYLIQEALKSCERLIIGIGSSNVSDNDNPFSYEARLAMVQKFIKEEGLQNKIEKIVPIPDVPDDEEWLKITLENSGKFDVSFGNNDWVNEIFKSKGIAVIEVPFYQRYLLEGTKIRELMREGKEWRDRVPVSLLDLINNPYK